MSKEEIIKFLKEKLTIEVEKVPSCPDYLEISLYLNGELISESQAELYYD